MGSNGGPGEGMFAGAIQGALRSMVGLKPSTGDGHTTSGLDRAMQQHADQQHPVKQRFPGNINPKTGRVVSAFDED